MSHGGNKKNLQTFKGLEVIAAITSHIPDRYAQMARYVVWYSNRMRGDRRKAEQEAQKRGEKEVAEKDVLVVSGFKTKKVPPFMWRECIKKIWEVDPLLCNHCGGMMKIISFIYERKVIKEILDHLGLYKEDNSNSAVEEMMKILGISGSPRKDEQSGVNQLVRTVLENTGCDYELISLRGKNISGCIACLGCVKDNVCKVDDDMVGLREKIVEADAYVFGAPNYYTTFNALFHAFIERWFQFRHQTGDTLWGKVAVAVGVGGTAGQAPADEIEKFLLYNFVETVSKVTGQGTASCYSCGHGESCQVGIPLMLHGPGVAITEEMVPRVGKQPELLKAAEDAGKLLGRRLKDGNDRAQTTQAMQQKMMAMFGETA